MTPWGPKWATRTLRVMIDCGAGNGILMNLLLQLFCIVSVWIVEVLRICTLTLSSCLIDELLCTWFKSLISLVLILQFSFLSKILLPFSHLVLCQLLLDHKKEYLWPLFKPICCMNNISFQFICLAISLVCIFAEIWICIMPPQCGGSRGCECPDRANQRRWVFGIRHNLHRIYRIQQTWNCRCACFLWQVNF